MTRRSRSSGPLPLDIYASLSDLGIDVDVRGDEAWALCPAHDDRKASWSVNLQSGGHKCFSCGFGGPFITLVKWMESVNDEHAREWIRKHGGFEHIRRKMRGEGGYVRPVADVVTRADLALFSKPPKWARLEKDVTSQACKDYRVLWNAKEDRWIFTLYNPYNDDELMGWQEKSTGVFINYPKHLSKGDAVFGAHLFTGGTAVVVESPIDAVHLRSHGVGGAISTMGVELSTAQMTWLLENADEILWALDNDKAGKEKMARIRKEYIGRIPMSFWNYGKMKVKDPGEQNAQEIFWSIENATHALSVKF